MIHRLIAAAERRLRVPLEYAHHLDRHDRRGLARFALFMPLSTHRRRLPVPVYHAARIAATRAEDCGTCLQITVNVALDDGMSPDLIRAILRGPVEALPEDVADAVGFAKAVASGTDPGEERDRLRARFGETALCELALAVAAARVFPATKRGLGFATSCALVQVEVPGEGRS